MNTKQYRSLNRVPPESEGLLRTVVLDCPWRVRFDILWLGFDELQRHPAMARRRDLDGKGLARRRERHISPVA